MNIKFKYNQYTINITKNKDNYIICFYTIDMQIQEYVLTKFILTDINKSFEVDTSFQFINILLHSNLFDYVIQDGAYKFQVNNSTKLQLL